MGMLRPKGIWLATILLELYTVKTMVVSLMDWHSIYLTNISIYCLSFFISLLRSNSGFKKILFLQPSKAVLNMCFNSEHTEIKSCT